MSNSPTPPPHQQAPAAAASLPKALFSTFFNGLKSSLSVHKSIIYLFASRTTSVRMLQCVLLNGVIFGGSLLVLDFLLLPALTLLYRALTSVPVLPASAETPHVEYFLLALRQVLTMFWLFPMLVLTLVLNTVWYQEIADQVFKQEHPKYSHPPRSLGHVARDEIYRSALILVLSVQSWACLFFLPFPLAQILALVQTSWTLAFYAYDYGWTLAGWPLEKRLRFFQERWVFMLGFGLPLGVLALALPLWSGFVVYALVFPVMMILALITPPTRHKRGWKEFKVFRLAQWVVFLGVKWWVGK
jgi:etoposide-induced 2.4 mRNA